MYPTRYIDNGNICVVEAVILNSLLIKGMAFAGREEPRVLLTTTIMPITTMDTFFFCTGQVNSVFEAMKDH